MAHSDEVLDHGPVYDDHPEEVVLQHTAETLMGEAIEPRSVESAEDVDEILTGCLKSFGGAKMAKIYRIIDDSIGRGLPFVLAASGPITVSGQQFSYFNPLLRTGWFMYATFTGAICYHDGHRGMYPYGTKPVRTVQPDGLDREHRDNQVIRVYDAGFKEKVLFDQDAMTTAMLMQPEFQRTMTGPEYRHLMGKYYDAQECANGVPSGLMATCYKHGIPVFVGAPADSSDMLNAVKLQAMARKGLIDFKFQIDTLADVYESCAYHYWGVTESELRSIGILILGGGVPKNYSLQPEPALSQIFLVEEVGGYDTDVQIVSVYPEHGCLTSCPPSEAHTWGKVKGEALDVTTATMVADYTTIMPFIAAGLLTKRKKFVQGLTSALARGSSEEDYFDRNPQARGYLRKELRLYDRREELVAKLDERITRPEHIEKLRETMNYPLKLLEGASV